jgi:general secretion pathway protein K
MSRYRTGPGPQEGLALVTAMLIVAIVAAIATSVSLAQQLWLRQTQNIGERAQTDGLRLGALNWVVAALARDATEGSVDHLGESWAKRLPPLPAEGGTVTVAVSDAQARFNLNNLVRNGAPSAVDVAIFQRLLRAHGLDPALVEAVIDWIDPDSQARPGGAEDLDYLGLSLPYRTANQALASVEELRLVKGFTAEAVERLRPYITALPEPTAINVNTATEPVLAALFAEPSASALAHAMTARERQPFTTPAQFLGALPPATPAPQASYGINSGYFIVTIDIRLGRLRQQTEALIQRPTGSQPTRVLWQRQRLPLPVREDENA